MASAVHMVARSSPVVKEPAVPAAAVSTRKSPQPGRHLKKMGRPRKDIPPNRLQFLRERHKAQGGFWLTTAEVATLLDIAESQVSRHEQHQRGLTEEIVMAYAKLYKVKPHQLFAHLTVSK